jgi:photosystem II stability/assembly factor-like uncharacterized protein
MTNTLFVASASGLFIAADSGGTWEVLRYVLRKKALTCVAVSGSVLLAGSRNGIFRSEDMGRTWTSPGAGPARAHVRWMASSGPSSGRVFAGTEPAGILVSRDAGLSWTAAGEVALLRDRLGWFLPYSPAAGCVRDFALGAGSEVSPIYAAVEVGGVLVSEDRGGSWRLVAGSDGRPDLDRASKSEASGRIHPDVHSLDRHEACPRILTAATGGGLYRSTDGGAVWRSLYRCYVRAVWVDRGDPRHIIAGPADGVSRNGRIERTRDGGRTWEPASGGTDAPWSRHMVERLLAAGGRVFAVLSNGELWTAASAGGPWQRILPEAGEVKALAAEPGFREPRHP